MLVPSFWIKIEGGKGYGASVARKMVKQQLKIRMFPIDKRKLNRQTIMLKREGKITRSHPICGKMERQRRGTVVSYTELCSKDRQLS